MKRLLTIMRRYLKESILGPLFKLLEATLELLVPLVVATIIDVGVKNADVPYIVRMSLLLIGFSAVGLAFSATAQFFAAKASVGSVSELRHDLFAHLGKLSYAQIDRLGTSTMITRITSDANQVQQGVNLTLRLLLRSPFVVFGAMIVAFTIDVPLALIFALTIPVLSLIVFGIMLVSIPLYRKVQAKLDSVFRLTKENLAGARVLRAFCKEDEECTEYLETNNELTHRQTFVGRITALQSPLTYVVVNLAIVALIWCGALKVDGGALSQGAVVALYNLMGQILIELVKLANLIVTITKSVASANRIDAVFAIVPDEGAVEEPDTVEGAALVRFEDASLTYPDAGEQALSHISFEAKRGQTIGIIGGTGSGKSTLVHMLAGFYPPSEGRVLIDGADIGSYPNDCLRKKIGIVMQKAVLFSGTVRENLTMNAEAISDEELYEVLRIAQADGVVRDKGGLDARIEQGGRNLSGGQRQRLSIARTLASKPEILILDDSASALDLATDKALREALRELRGTTMFIVSQRAASIMHADLILTLDDGELVGCGTHGELLASCEVYREIYESQFGKEKCPNEA